MSVEQITPIELKKKLSIRERFPFFLLDVRNQNEQEICFINGTDRLIPHLQILEEISSLQDLKEKEIVIYCKGGVRSMQVCEFLDSQGFKRLYNLEGGILAYIDDVDTSLAKY